MFSSIYVGQRVYFTGLTSYGRNVKRKPGTVIQVKNCIIVQLDDSRSQYHTWVTNPATGHRLEGIEIFPPKQIGTIRIGDLADGSKIIEPM